MHPKTWALSTRISRAIFHFGKLQEIVYGVYRKETNLPMSPKQINVYDVDFLRTDLRKFFTRFINTICRFEQIFSIKKHGSIQK